MKMSRELDTAIRLFREQQQTQSQLQDDIEKYAALHTQAIKNKERLESELRLTERERDSALDDEMLKGIRKRLVSAEQSATDAAILEKNIDAHISRLRAELKGSVARAETLRTDVFILLRNECMQKVIEQSLATLYESYAAASAAHNAGMGWKEYLASVFGHAPNFDLDGVKAEIAERIGVPADPVC